jgi:hypothetical protein
VCAIVAMYICMCSIVHLRVALCIYVCTRVCTCFVWVVCLCCEVFSNFLFVDMASVVSIIQIALF